MEHNIYINRDDYCQYIVNYILKCEHKKFLDQTIYADNPDLERAFMLGMNHAASLSYTLPGYEVVENGD